MTTPLSSPPSATGSQQRGLSGPALVLALSAAYFVLQLGTANRYGVFRDELYYLACSEHLAAGYVDQPPLIAFIACFARHAFGESLYGLRLLPALAGAFLVWLTGRLAREMGGGTFAQVFSAFAVAAASVYLVMFHWLTMNAFEVLIWMGCVYIVVRVIHTEDQKLWLWFGVLAGVGMENKYSIVFLLFGLFVGLLLTRERKHLLSRWMWIGAALALLIFLPNLIWLVRHNFPFLELMRNIRHSGRDVVRSPVAFILDQTVIMNPALAPLWFAGLAWLMFSPAGRKFRVLGWAYLAMLVAFIALKGKNYYLSPSYPMLFAAGAVALERLTSQRHRWPRTAYAALAIVISIALAPMMLPVLSPERYIRYQKTLGFEPPRAENQRTGPLPQYYADMFGWKEMAEEVARIYNSLPPDERARTAVFANGYGQGGAIDFFGPKLGLPKAIGGHQNYWFWGPRDYTGESLIVLGDDREGIDDKCESVLVVGRTYHPLSRRDEHFEIFLCHKLKWNLKDIWPRLKEWH